MRTSENNPTSLRNMIINSALDELQKRIRQARRAVGNIVEPCQKAVFAAYLVRGKEKSI